MAALRRIGFESRVNSRYTLGNTRARREDIVVVPNREERPGWTPCPEAGGASLNLERR
jgi:hypothetical protein